MLLGVRFLPPKYGLIMLYNGIWKLHLRIRHVAQAVRKESTKEFNISYGNFIASLLSRNIELPILANSASGQFLFENVERCASDVRKLPVKKT